MISVNYEGCFGDKRIERRGEQLRNSLFCSATHSIKAIAGNWAEQKAYYRFLHNDKASEEQLIVEMTERCERLVEGKVVLSIQDTSEVNLVAHNGRLKPNSGVGNLDYRGDIGFKIHPSFVVDAGSCFPLGFS